MSRHVAVALLTVAASQSAAASQPAAPLRVVQEVDLQRYAGTWYEIARLPNRFQRACVSDVTATYALQPDNRIAVIGEEHPGPILHSVKRVQSA